MKNNSFMEDIFREETVAEIRTWSHPADLEHRANRAEFIQERIIAPISQWRQKAFKDGGKHLGKLYAETAVEAARHKGVQHFQFFQKTTLAAAIDVVQTAWAIQQYCQNMQPIPTEEIEYLDRRWKDFIAWKGRDASLDRKRGGDVRTYQIQKEKEPKYAEIKSHYLDVRKENLEAVEKAKKEGKEKRILTDSQIHKKYQTKYKVEIPVSTYYDIIKRIIPAELRKRFLL